MSELILYNTTANHLSRIDIDLNKNINLIDFINKHFYSHRSNVSILDVAGNHRFNISTHFGKNILNLSTSNNETLDFYYKSLAKTFKSVDRQKKILSSIVKNTLSNSDYHCVRVSINLKHHHHSFVLLSPQSSDCKKLIEFLHQLNNTDEKPVKIEITYLPSEHHEPKVIYLNGHVINNESLNIIEQYIISNLS